MEILCDSYKAGRGTRQPREDVFYSPDLEFAVIAHRTCFTGETFLKFCYDKSSLENVKKHFSNKKTGEFTELEVPDGVVRQIQELGKVYQKTRVSLDPLVQRLFELYRKHSNNIQ